MTDKIVLMQPLHDDDNAAGTLVVKAGQKRVVVPLVDRFAADLGERLIRFQRAVDDDDVRATAGQNAANRGRHPRSSGGRRIVVNGLAGR